MPSIREHQHVDMPRDSFFRWQVHDEQSRTSSNLLHQQRGQNLLDQCCKSIVSLRIASLAATAINKRRSQLNAAQTRVMKQILAAASDRVNTVGNFMKFKCQKLESPANYLTNTPRSFIKTIVYARTKKNGH